MVILLPKAADNMMTTTTTTLMMITTTTISNTTTTTTTTTPMTCFPLLLLLPFHLLRSSLGIMSSWTIRVKFRAGPFYDDAAYGFCNKSMPAGSSTPRPFGPSFWWRMPTFVPTRTRTTMTPLKKSFLLRYHRWFIQTFTFRRTRLRTGHSTCLLQVVAHPLHVVLFFWTFAWIRCSLDSMMMMNDDEWWWSFHNNNVFLMRSLVQGSNKKGRESEGDKT